jgi:hypothetical protein
MSKKLKSIMTTQYKVKVSIRLNQAITFNKLSFLELPDLESTAT